MTPFFLRHTRGATALLPLRTLMELLENGDGYSKILIEPAENTTTSSLIAELQNSLDNGKYSVLGSVVPIFKSRTMKLVEEIKFE